jgi:hypothetical protein
MQQGYTCRYHLGNADLQQQCGSAYLFKAKRVGSNLTDEMLTERSPDLITVLCLLKDMQ